MAGDGAPVISVYDVSKRFVTHRRKATSLKERIVNRERGGHRRRVLGASRTSALRSARARPSA